MTHAECAPPGGWQCVSCATRSVRPIITDRWPGLETFFSLGDEIVVADDASDVIGLLAEMPQERRRAIAAGARKRVLHNHTAAHRAQALESYVAEVRAATPRKIVEAVA